MTLLGLTNYFLQLFFIRLTRNQEKVITGFDMQSACVFSGVSGKITAYEIHKWYSIMYWVIPFTGWSTDFKYIGKAAKYLRLTKTKITKL